MSTEREVAAFLQRIDKWLADSPGGAHRGRHRAAFIALRPLIEGALASGFTMKATWAALREEKKISMSYQTFRMHCWRAGIGGRSGAVSPSEETPQVFRHGRAPRRGDIN
jgi:hypothetical protein